MRLLAGELVKTDQYCSFRPGRSRSFFGTLNVQKLPPSFAVNHKFSIQYSLRVSEDKKTRQEVGVDLSSCFVPRTDKSCNYCWDIFWALLF